MTRGKQVLGREEFRKLPGYKKELTLRTSILVSNFQASECGRHAGTAERCSARPTHIVGERFKRAVCDEHLSSTDISIARIDEKGYIIP